MIKLELNSQKELSISKSAKVFKGENLINSIQVTALNPYVGDKRVEDCEFHLHAVLPDKSYIIYPIAWSENSIPLTGFVPITADITSQAQFVKLYIEITSGNTVIGKSNTVKLQVYDSPEEQTSVTPREQLEQEIAELESELESASTLTETLAQLSGDYDSFPERLEDDEANIAANTRNITANQSAIVSLTAAINNKLNNAPNSVSSSNIADNAVTTDKIAGAAVTTSKLANSAVTAGKIVNGAVTTEKIADLAVGTTKLMNNSVTSAKLAGASVTADKLADHSVSYSKLSTALQDIVDNVPDIPMFVVNYGTVSAANFFNAGDYCTLGGVYQFYAVDALASEIGVSECSYCELRYINGYQVVTQTVTHQIFKRRISRVAPTFQADDWVEVISPAVTSLQTTVSNLQTTVGTLNSQLENTLGGGV